MKKQLNTFWKIYIISSIFVPFMWVINIPIICLILPLYLTWKNIRHFMALLEKQLKEYVFWLNDGLIFFLGTGLSWLALEMAQVVYVDWPETLVNIQLHSPIQTEAWSGQFFLLLMGVFAYLVLNIYQTKLLPPLLTVLIISCLYPSFVFAVLWTIQLSTLIETDFFTYCYLCLVPFNICFIYSRTILQTIQLWQAELAKQSNPRFPRLSALLQKSLSLPIWLLFFSLPYLAVLGVVYIHTPALFFFHSKENRPSLVLVFEYQRRLHRETISKLFRYPISLFHTVNSIWISSKPRIQDS